MEVVIGIIVLAIWGLTAYEVMRRGHGYRTGPGVGEAKFVQHKPRKKEKDDIRGGDEGDDTRGTRDRPAH